MRADFYVAVDGDDASPGTAERPFATISAAQDAVRGLCRNGLQQHATVQIGGGTYRLMEPLVFGPNDSGTDEFRVIYAAAPGEKPILSGGRRISGWRETDTGRWETLIPEVKAGSWYFRQLFVNGHRGTRARAPNDGFFRVDAAGPDNRTSFRFQEGDLTPSSRQEDAELVFLSDWSISRVRIKEVNAAARAVTFCDPIGPAAADFYAISGFEPHARYYVENAPEFLDIPGEWYLDRKTGLLTYQPLQGEAIDAVEAVAPVLQRLLTVSGDLATGRPVRNLHFVGLTFAHTEFQLPTRGYAEVQACFAEQRPNPLGRWNSFPPQAAVAFVHAVNCSIDGCEICHTGAAGVGIAGRSRNNQIVGCDVFDIGMNGVMVFSEKNNTVSDCRIHHCGVVGHGGVGVWVGLTEATAVTRNEISHLPYTGVSVGWKWDHTPTPCRNNLIAFNHIHHVMQLLSDGGGIYTLGLQPGTVLRGNLIHDISAAAGKEQSNGIFMDQASTGILVEGNGFFRISQAPIRFNQAGRNELRKNVLWLSPTAQPLQDAPPGTVKVDNFVETDEGDKLTAAIEQIRAEAGPDGVSPDVSQRSPRGRDWHHG